MPDPIGRRKLGLKLAPVPPLAGRPTWETGVVGAQPYQAGLPIAQVVPLKVAVAPPLPARMILSPAA